MACSDQSPSYRLCLPITKPSIHYDNKGCLDSIAHGKYHSYSVAHIVTKCQLAVEIVTNDIIISKSIPSCDNLANAMTKALPNPAFINLLGFMGLVRNSSGKDI